MGKNTTMWRGAFAVVVLLLMFQALAKSHALIGHWPSASDGMAELLAIAFSSILSCIISLGLCLWLWGWNYFTGASFSQQNMAVGLGCPSLGLNMFSVVGPLGLRWLMMMEWPLRTGVTRQYHGCLHMFSNNQCATRLADLVAVTPTTKFPDYHHEVWQQFDLKHPIEIWQRELTTTPIHKIALPVGCSSNNVESSDPL